MTALTATLAGRAAAERIMLATCLIFRPDPEQVSTWDPVNGDGDAPIRGTEIYTGKCRIRQPGPADKAQNSGGFVWTLQDSVLSVPISAGGIKLKDMVTITESPNPNDVGAVFEVVFLPRGTFTTARRFVVRETP